jgi:hypothetical protein
MVLWLFSKHGGSNAYEKANMFMYMANEEGRKAGTLMSEHSNQKV